MTDAEVRELALHCWEVGLDAQRTGILLKSLGVTAEQFWRSTEEKEEDE